MFYFMSVLLVHHLQQLSTYITETVGRNRKLLPQQFKNKFTVEQKCTADLFPSRMFFSARRKKNPVILLSSHVTAQEEEVRGRHGANSQIKPKIITSYNKFTAPL
jgi:hypothetical protein